MLILSVFLVLILSLAISNGCKDIRLGLMEIARVVLIIHT